MRPTITTAARNAAAHQDVIPRMTVALQPVTLVARVRIVIEGDDGMSLRDEAVPSLAVKAG